MKPDGYVWHWVRLNFMPYPWSPVRVWHERVGEARVLDVNTYDDVIVAEWGPRIYEPGEVSDG